MAKSFLESLEKIERSTNRLTLQDETLKLAALASEVKPVEAEIAKAKSKAGRKPIRQYVYVKRTIEVREDLLAKLESAVYDKRSSKREEIEKALENYLK